MTRPAIDSEATERVTVSSVPISRETRVASRVLEVDPAYIDRLLVAACDLPIARGEAAVVEFLVRALGEIFPDHGVGACFVPAPQSSRDGRASVVEQQLFKYVPEGEEGRGIGVDPTRLFPGFVHERVLDVDDDGTTLHLASDNDELAGEDSPMIHVARRAALAMRRGLTLARSHAKATEDARDLRALNSHMVQAEKLASLGQLAAGVVHELNNPLTSIVAYTDWLIRKAGPNGDPDSLERLRRIGESASRILRFTRDLVAYARPSSEVPVPVSIHNVMDQALAFCEHVLAEHGARVERSFAPHAPTVRGMPEQLAQVFVNLFTNACHAMPEAKGCLSVGSVVSEDGAWLSVVVEDNGHGIANEHLGSIFTPFFTTKGDGRGTGIRAERSALGGARFVVVFPVA
jgi:two-component system, NtrC family, sensor kinase